MLTVFIVLGVQIAFSLFIVAWVRSRVRSHLDESKTLERIRTELNALMVELDASADRNVSVLEDRIAQVKDLVAEADRRIALLSQEESRRAVESAVYNRLGRFRSPAEQAIETSREVRQAQTAPTVAGATSAAGIAAAPGSAAAVGSPPGIGAAAGVAAVASASPGLGAQQANPAAPPRNPYDYSRPPASQPVPDAARELDAERSPFEAETPPPERSVLREPAARPAGPPPFLKLGGKSVEAEPGFVDRVLDLYRRGFSGDVIAARTGATLAEVGLVIAMEEGRRGSGGET